MVPVYFATERGRLGYDKYRHDFAKLIWKLGFTQWNFDDDTFERSAAALNNADHVEIVVHNYRWRLGLAEGEPNTTISSSDWPGHRHRRADDHARRRCQRRAPPTAVRVCQAIHGQVCASPDRRRDRAQLAAGSAAGVCASRDRCRSQINSISRSLSTSSSAPNDAGSKRWQLISQVRRSSGRSSQKNSTGSRFRRSAFSAARCRRR